MDIVVEHIDGTIINLEIQNIGYDFPDERTACYASDLTIRRHASGTVLFAWEFSREKNRP